jgi:carbon storage regulator CsrA
MIVLSRRVGQEIFIGDVRLIVVGHDGRRVRLAIDAPPDVKILRQELVANRDTELTVQPEKAEVALV